MSNKTSDENVGSIEEDIKNLEKYIELVIDKNYCECNELNVICYGKYADGSKNVASSIKNILKDYARQKQINEEHQKINGELREQVRMLEEDIKEIKESIEEAYRCYEYDLDYSPFSKGIAEMIENILAEREQDKKRIQELEKALLKVKDKNATLFITCRNSIAKEKVIDVIQEYKNKVEQYNKYREQGKETDVEYYENIANTIVVQVLQELLEGERK